MLVAADTFRAGAVAQLAEWGRRVGVPVVTGPEADPASVVLMVWKRAVAENVDVLLIDTAGRLQNKDNLMAELEKLVVSSSAWYQMRRMKLFLLLMLQQVKMLLVKLKNFQKSLR